MSCLKNQGIFLGFSIVSNWIILLPSPEPNKEKTASKMKPVTEKVAMFENIVTEHNSVFLSLNNAAAWLLKFATKDDKVNWAIDDTIH